MLKKINTKWETVYHNRKMWVTVQLLTINSLTTKILQTIKQVFQVFPELYEPVASDSEIKWLFQFRHLTQDKNILNQILFCI